MNTYALLLVGQKQPEYFKCDKWRVDDACLRLLESNGNAFAVFSMNNVVGLVNLDANAHLTAVQAVETIDPSLPLNLRPRNA